MHVCDEASRCVVAAVVQMSPLLQAALGKISPGFWFPHGEKLSLLSPHLWPSVLFPAWVSFIPFFICSIWVSASGQEAKFALLMKKTATINYPPPTVSQQIYSFGAEGRQGLYEWLLQTGLSQTPLRLHQRPFCKSHSKLTNLNSKNVSPTLGQMVLCVDSISRWRTLGIYLQDLFWFLWLQHLRPVV